MVQHSPRHPKVEGSSPATAAVEGRGNMAKKFTEIIHAKRIIDCLDQRTLAEGAGSVQLTYYLIYTACLVRNKSIFQH